MQSAPETRLTWQEFWRGFNAQITAGMGNRAARRKSASKAWRIYKRRNWYEGTALCGRSVS